MISKSASVSVSPLIFPLLPKRLQQLRYDPIVALLTTIVRAISNHEDGRRLSLQGKHFRRHSGEMLSHVDVAGNERAVRGQVNVGQQRQSVLIRRPFSGEKLWAKGDRGASG